MRDKWIYFQAKWNFAENHTHVCKRTAHPNSRVDDFVFFDAHQKPITATFVDLVLYSLCITKAVNMAGLFPLISNTITQN